jgi:hypothetical protein
MAEEKVEPREMNIRQWLPWTELFRGFQVALDPKKLLLAAAGILVMAAGWWVLGAIFYRDKPSQSDFQATDYQRKDQNLSPEEAQLRAARDYNEALARWTLLDRAANKSYGKLRTWPWFEDRGPNPYLLVTGQVQAAEGKRDVPWAQGGFTDWFLGHQLPYLIEPLVKFFQPVIFLFDANAGGWNRVYFLLVTLYTLAVWALFGGAITRMAAVQVARNEKISLMEAIRFVAARYLSFLSAPLFPLVFIAVVAVFLLLFGVVHMIPIAGEIIDGLLWVLPLLGALAMAVVLVGLVGWPLMSATISAEGSDSFDAISRSYSYVYQSPWHYIWNSLVAICYGAVVVFFVGFMGSMVVYLAKWGVSQGSIERRDPSFLFVWAPESFGWRTLLLQGATVGGNSVVQDGRIVPEVYDRYLTTFNWWNYIGTTLVTIWIYLFFLMILGFAYSYFWSASTIIYLLMRRKVDDTDFDEVYLEEDETEEAYTPPKPASTPPGAITTPGVTMVESPTLRTSPPSAPPVTTTPSAITTSPRTESATTAPSKGDGDGDKSSSTGPE